MDRADAPRIWQPETIEQVAGAVLTCGTFAILHLGHLLLFEAAAQHGPLVVAVQSDDAIRQYRRDVPFWLPLHERLRLISSLRPVYAATWYDEETAGETILHLRPRTFVKGKDYSLKKLPLAEREMCERVGATILFLTPKVRSSRALINHFCNQGALAQRIL